jgi:3-oxoacyl-[acyl-carrier protein] reductase
MGIDRTLTHQPKYVHGHGLLAGRTVVLTAGAGAGIGGSVARRCLEEGARGLVIGDVHQRRLTEFHQELATAFGADRVAAVRCDVSDESQVEELLDAAEPFGGVDIMINNAGVGGTTAIQDMTDAEWSGVLDVTLTGAFRCLRASARRMIGRGDGGVIINNASIVGWRAHGGQAHYSAAKAGVMALTRSASVDLAPHGIRVNAVAPSVVMNPFLVKATSQETLDEMIRREAFGRSAEPWEIANVMVFLASDYSSYMTGEVVSVGSQHA